MKRNYLRILAATLLAASVCLASGIAVSAESPKDTTNASQAFERLKTLVGHWEGTTSAGKIALTYDLVSGGTVLVEREFMPPYPGDSDHDEMVTVYNLDNGRLVLTHYCHAGNQPHMQARPFAAGSNEIDFDYVGAGNLTGEAADHVMHRLVLKLNGPDELAAEWTLYERGAALPAMPFLYHRVK